MTIEKKRTRLPRVGALQLDCARNILKTAAENDSVIDYNKIALQYMEEEKIPLDKIPDPTKYFFKSVLIKSPGGIYFSRKKSNKLTEEMLIHAQNEFNYEQDISKVAEKLKIKDLQWEDLFVGYNPNYKSRKKRNKYKQIAKIIENHKEISETIIEMFNNYEKIPKITEYINKCISEGIDGIDSSIIMPKDFTQDFIHNFKNIPRKKRLTEDKKFQRDEDIKLMLKEGKTYEEIAKIINEKYGTRQKSSSIRATVYYRKLNDRSGKRGRTKKYLVENLSENIRDFISVKYGKEGVSINKIKETLGSQMNFEIPKHGLIRLIKDMKLTKGKIKPTPEQREWLREHAPSCLSQQELAEDFNKNFNTNYEEDTIRKFDAVGVS